MLDNIGATARKYVTAYASAGDLPMQQGHAFDNLASIYLPFMWVELAGELSAADASTFANTLNGLFVIPTVGTPLLLAFGVLFVALGIALILWRRMFEKCCSCCVQEEKVVPYYPA